MSLLVRAARSLTVMTFGTLVLTACSGVYFNTTFNAEKAHEKALSLRAERIRENPDDTVQVSAEERLLLQRAVRKSSKVLELWPDHPTYAPRAVYRIAECQYLMEDYASAAVKYDEFLRYFPDHEQVPMARVRLAQAHFEDGRILAAREALETATAGTLEGDARREALLLSARMMIADRTSDQTGDARADAAASLAVYEQLLQEGSLVTPEARNEVRWRASQLARELQDWEKARAYALAANEGVPPMRIQFRNRRIGVLSLYELNRHGEGLADVREMLGQRPYRAFRSELKLLEARGVYAGGDWPAARRLYRESIRFAPREASAAESWFRMGEHFLDVENREDSARVLFDSAAATSRAFEFSMRGAEYGSALKRLAELRVMDSAGTYDRREAALKVSETVAAREDSAAAPVDTAALSAQGSGGSGGSGGLAGADSAAPVAAAATDRARSDSLARARIAELAERYPDVPADIREARALQDSLDQVAAARGRGDTARSAPRAPRPPSVQYAPFMMAEVFQFQLSRPDSARVYLERIVADTAGTGEDSVFTRRALYALAALESDGVTAPDGTVLRAPNPARGAQLYRTVIARYPATEWAKAAERNLGLPPTVKTPHDSARALLVEAERRRFAGEDLVARVRPAYEAVVTRYPASPAAARAQLAIAFLTEQAAAEGRLGTPGQARVDTVKAEYERVRDRFSGTPQADAAMRRLDILNINLAEAPPSDGRGGRGQGDDELFEETGDDGSRPPRVELEDASEQDLY